MITDQQWAKFIAWLLANGMELGVPATGPVRIQPKRERPPGRDGADRGIQGLAH